MHFHCVWSLLLATATIASAVNSRWNATCLNSVCHCVEGGCAGDDNVCHEGQTNTQMGGNSQVYRIRNARWPKWYMYIQTSNTQLRVKEGKDKAGPSEFQWTVLTPPSSNGQPLRLMFTEWKRDTALTYGTRRLCTEIRDGVELELMNASDGEVPDDNQEPGPDGPELLGEDVNGVPLELVLENMTVKEAEIAMRDETNETEDDLDDDGLWLEDEDEDEDGEGAASIAENKAGQEELSHRSRYSSYYSRSRTYYSSRSRSYYYDRSRYSSYYDRSRSFYSRSRSFNSYSYYYDNYYYDSPRRRVYCRDVPVPTAVNVATAGTSMQTVGIKFEVAPVSSGVPDLPLYMLSGAAYPGQYLFVPRYVSTVDIHVGDPGAGGYWFFDPPLPAGPSTSNIPSFAGTQCSWFCAGVGNIADVGTTFVDGAHRPGKVVAFLASAAAAASTLVFCAP